MDVHFVKREEYPFATFTAKLDSIQDGAIIRHIKGSDPYSIPDPLDNLSLVDCYKVTEVVYNISQNGWSWAVAFIIPTEPLAPGSSIRSCCVCNQPMSTHLSPVELDRLRRTSQSSTNLPSVEDPSVCQSCHRTRPSAPPAAGPYR